MSKRTEPAWAKVREGQQQVGLLSTNAGGRLDQFAQRLDENAPEEELGRIAREGAVAFRALSKACDLAASGGEDLVRVDPLHMDRRQAFNMGQAAGQRHNVGIFHELSTGFVSLARHYGANVGKVDSDAKELADTIVEKARNRPGW